MDKIIKAAIYARVSTEEQAEHGYSIDAQLETLRNYCKAHGKVVYKEYVDRGVSGKSMEGRYELKRLLQDAENNEFQEVVVWKINRLARKTIDLLKIVETLTKHNIAFRSFSENFETESPMGRFALQMMGAVGELERNTIVDNVKMGMRQRARTGLWNGGKVLGYKSEDPESGSRKARNTSLEIVPEEALLARKIFELFACGKGLRAIANQLNREGHKTKRGNPFSTTAIKDIITNPLYVGKIRFNRFENWNDKRRRGKNNEPILVDGEHEPIISPELWEKVQLLQKQKSKKSPRAFDGQYILTGLLKCPVCGSAMVANRTKNTLKDGTVVIRRYYSCSNFRSKGASVCQANSVQADYAEQYVFSRIREVILKKTILKQIVLTINQKKRERIKPLTEELRKLESTIKEIDSRRQKYFDLYEEDSIDKEIFVQRVDELGKETDTLWARKSEIEYLVEDNNSLPVSFEDVRIVLSRVDDLLRGSPPEQCKSLLHLIIKKITVTKKRQIQNIELTFNSEFQSHFLNLAPSGNQPEGAFVFSKGKPQQFTVII